MVDRIRYPTVSYLPFYYVFVQFLLLTIFNLQANILTTKDILSNLAHAKLWNPNCTIPVPIPGIKARLTEVSVVDRILLLAISIPQPTSGDLSRGGGAHLPGGEDVAEE